MTGRMFSRLPVLFVGCVVGCTAIDIEQPADNLPYRCSDLVVVGRVVTLSGESIAEPTPLPNWESKWQLLVSIKRLVRGSELRAVIPATAISHSTIRSDRDFLVVLTPAEGGGYVLTTAALWNVTPSPRLAKSCS